MSRKTKSAPVADDISTDEIDLAADETPTEAVAPELSEGTRDLEEWDTPPDSLGHEAPRSEMEDEVSAVEELVEEGLDQADRDQRLASSDPDFEP